MAPKQGLRKRPAAGSHETFGDLQPGFLLDDASRLDRRAKQAAMQAAARYPTPNGLSISCICIGQPLVDDRLSPYPEECEPNAERWILPDRPSHIRLAFKWEIFEGGTLSATETASCVVYLKNAEKRGVPLPTGWGPKVADLLDGSLQSAGTFGGPRTYLELVALCVESKCCPAYALIFRYSKTPQCSTKNRQMRPRRRRQCWKSVLPPQNGRFCVQAVCRDGGLSAGQTQVAL